MVHHYIISFLLNTQFEIISNSFSGVFMFWYSGGFKTVRLILLKGGQFT
jgi:hypothetical protein